MVLKPGWLNRQFDQVTKDVETWPEWMKRAAGFAFDSPPSECEHSPESANGQVVQQRERGAQVRLNLK